MSSLQTIYQNQLGRDPDPGGLAHYQAQLDSGVSLDTIRNEIANSPEAKSRGVGAYASNGGGGGSSSQSQAAPAPKYNTIVGTRGEVNFDGLPRGRGMSSLYNSLRAAEKARSDLFQGRVRDGDLALLEGYSFTGGPGKTLVDTIAYKGNDTNPDGRINIYKDAAKEEEPDTGDDDVDEGPADTGTDEVVDTGPNYEDLINQALGSIPSISDITNAINNANAASEERIRAMNEENRKLYINDQRNRASEARTPNLQIRGAGETPSTAGSQGFRRRKDQFKIAPFQGISGALGIVGQVAQNKLVNI